VTVGDHFSRERMSESGTTPKQRRA